VAIEGGYGGGWAEFTIRDLTALAIIQRLVRYNAGVERAAELVELALNAVWRAEYESFPGCTTQKSEGFTFPNEPPPLPSRLYMFTDHEGKERVNWGTASDIVDADSWVVIDVHQTISSAVTRALENISIEVRNRVLDRIDALGAQQRKIDTEAAQQSVQAALREAGIAIEFEPDGTAKVLAEKPKAVSRRRRTRKAKKP